MQLKKSVVVLLVMCAGSGGGVCGGRALRPGAYSSSSHPNTFTQEQRAGSPCSVGSPYSRYCLISTGTHALLLSARCRW